MLLPFVAQQQYNEDHHITPKGIQKEVGAGLRAIIPEKEKESKLDLKKVPPEEIPNLIKHLKGEMQMAAANLEFERAAALRDLIRQIEEGKK